MDKRKISILIVVVAVIVLMLCFFGKGNTLYDDPADMAEGALICIQGWRDIDMLMSLTPYTEGTEIYDIAYSYFLKMMNNPGWVSNYSEIGNADLKKADKQSYEEMKNELENYNITGVKSIKSYTFQYNGSDEITIYVSKIGRKWFTVMAE